MIFGTLIGALHGWLIAYRSIPAFIVTLGGLMVWRGMSFLSAGGRTISPVDSTFALLGGGPYGAVGAVGSWIVGALACLGVAYIIYTGRKSRRKHDFRLRPIWAEYFLAIVGWATIIGAVLLVNSYPWPKGIVRQYQPRFCDPSSDFDYSWYLYDYLGYSYPLWSLCFRHWW